MSYDFSKIEKKWQDRWEKNPQAQTKPTGEGKKYYCLDMFPYPSGSGLHVGHWKGYVLSDIYARMKWLQGFNVLHPMGWDAFGLPAENDAIKKSILPQEGTAKNIANFKRQLKHIGAIYDWDKELSTTDPEYYKWTQWIFLQMFKAGLAYQSDMPINWCTSCLTGLANEEVIDGKCERCGSLVTQKKIPQWVLKITDYAEKLLDGLDTVDWPEKVKTMQRNWIGKSEGIEINFTTTDRDGKTIELPLYTTRPDTIFGVTFLAMAPDSPLVDQIVSEEQEEAINNYREMVRSARAMGHGIDDKDKTGVFFGAYAYNPVTKEQVPIYLSSYVLSEYGTGIVMAVPGHDERDFDFAKKFKLPIKQVIQSDDVCTDAHGNMQRVYTGDGKLINSGPFDGLDAKKEGVQKIIYYIVSQGFGKRKTNYRLRDWIFSRQRYWGEPIPLIHCAKCGIIPVPEDQLPVELPYVEKYQPTGTGESPLAAIDDWVNVACPKCGASAKRETNTMPQWAGSCWYFLRYPNPHLSDTAWSMQDMNYWLPVDLYVGGIEHAILHLLYARFYVKILHDLGYLPFDEPFKQLFNQGMILKHSDKSGLVEKMSKSKGNVVDPDEIVRKYGSDALRMYMMFMGPPELDCEWQNSGLEGIKRFLNKFWNFLTNEKILLPKGEKEDPAVTKRLHKLIRDFQNRLAHYKPNTAISALMEWLNEAQANNTQLSHDSAEKLLVSLSVLAPFLGSELLEQLLGKQLSECAWPVFDPVLVQENTVNIIVQVNGKLRANLVMPVGADQAEIEREAKKLILKWLNGKETIKVVFVKDRLINFVVR